MSKTIQPFTIGDIIRTIIFSLMVIISTIALSIFLIPSLFSKKVAKFCAMTWVEVLFILSKHIAKVNYHLHNPEIFNKNGVIVACNHCSVWETFFISRHFHTPIFILKKSLFYIPIVGQFFKLLGMIGIERNGYNKQHRNKILQTTNNALKLGQNIAIFPQGTRVPIAETFNYHKYPFKSGIAMFAGGNTVLTASTNARKYFGKGLFSLKRKGTVHIKFNEILHFSQNETKHEIIDAVQKSIENGCKEIINL